MRYPRDQVTARIRRKPLGLSALERELRSPLDHFQSTPLTGQLRPFSVRSVRRQHDVDDAAAAHSELARLLIHARRNPSVELHVAWATEEPDGSVPQEPGSDAAIRSRAVLACATLGRDADPMCHFINLVLPAEADVEAVRQLAKRHGRLLERNPEPLIARALRLDERAYLTSRSCDCGTSLGRQIRHDEHADDREVARLRGEGWSETKLRRWREQRLEGVARKAVAREQSQRHELGQWIALIADLLDAKLDHVGLLVHWVTDDIRRGPVRPRASLSFEALAAIEENVLYTFTRRK